MQKLMERLDRQDELLLSLQPSGKVPNPIERIRMFDNQDLCMLLQISKRTLQRYRSIGALPYKTLGKKTYYSEEDVLTSSLPQPATNIAPKSIDIHSNNTFFINISS